MQDYPVNMAIKPIITAFFDVSTNTISCAFCDTITKSRSVIDSDMDRLDTTGFLDILSGKVFLSQHEAQSFLQANSNL